MEEINEVMGDRTEVEADDLDKLTYLTQVTTVSLHQIPLLLLVRFWKRPFVCIRLLPELGGAHRQVV